MHYPRPSSLDARKTFKWTEFAQWSEKDFATTIFFNAYLIPFIKKREIKLHNVETLFTILYAKILQREHCPCSLSKLEKSA